MVAKQVRVIVLEVPTDSCCVNTTRSRVREMKAEADPFIAGLIEKLQAEVRQERAEQSLSDRLRQRGLSMPCGEAPLPLSETELDFELPEYEDDWPLLKDLEELG